MENPNFLDGIDDDNRGDKVGKVAFSGKIQSRNGTLYLFETEGRNIAAIDSAHQAASASKAPAGRSRGAWFHGCSTIAIFLAGIPVVWTRRSWWRASERPALAT